MVCEEELAFPFLIMVAGLCLPEMFWAFLVGLCPDCIPESWGEGVRATTLLAKTVTDVASGGILSVFIPWMALRNRRALLMCTPSAVAAAPTTRVPTNQPWWGIQRRKIAAAPRSENRVRVQARAVRSG